MTRLVFLGTPAAAVPSLEALVHHGHDVSLVVTRPDRRRGRGPAASASPVKEAALRLGLAVTDRLTDVVDADADLGVVAAYGRIIPVDVLERVPMVNVHFSLLPRRRGAAPVERAILAGDTVTGVCIMAVEAGLDTGGIYAEERLRIEPDESAAALSVRLAEVGAVLLIQTLRGVREAGPAALPLPQPQIGDATYAAKIEPGDRELHWSEPARQLARVVRIGRASTTFRGRRLLVVRATVLDADDRVADEAPAAATPEEAASPPGALNGSAVVTGAGRLQLLEVKPDGSRSMPAEDWIRGVRPTAGELLGQ